MLTAIIVVSLCFCGAYGEGSSLISSVGVVQTGKHCVEVAQSVVEATSQNNAEQATADLQSLQAEVGRLENHARSKIALLEGKRDNLRGQLDAVDRKIAESSQRENDLRKQSEITEASLVTERRTQEANKNEETAAKKEVQNAENRLRDKKKGRKKKKKRGGLFGAVAGFVAGGPVGAVVGGLAGAAGGHILSELQGDVDRAKRKLRDKEQALRNAQAAVQRTEQLITTQQKELSKLATEITSKKSDLATLSREAGKVREAIVFQLEAAEVWNTFLLSTEDAGGKTELLGEIVTKATKKKNWNILRSDGTKMVEASFLEAWEEVETTAQATGSYHGMFLIQ